MIDKIKKIEIEITSDCNAACPGCARTKPARDGTLEINHIRLDDLKRILPNKTYMDGKIIRLCGTLGDPMIHPQISDIVEYFLSNGANVFISTNAGVGTIDTWHKLGMLSNIYQDKLLLQACIDGHRETNHIYRVNTKFSIIERNLNEYTKNMYKGPKHKNKWVYIVFDHNEHEIEIAKEHAHRLGLRFLLRTGMRNTFNNWIAEIGKKDNKQKKVITTTGAKEHKRKKEVFKLDELISNNSIDKDVIKTIVCRYVHDGEIFISSNQEMWPCCYLWDHKFKNEESMEEILSYQTGWNSLRKHSIEEILQHPWYDKVLEESWNPTHNKHFSKCIRNCAYNKAYENAQVEQTV